MIEATAKQLAAGKMVRMASSGSFSVCGTRPQTTRNPRTGEAAPVSARRVLVFRRTKKRMEERISGVRFGEPRWACYTDGTAPIAPPSDSACAMAQ